MTPKRGGDRTESLLWERRKGLFKLQKTHEELATIASLRAESATSDLQTAG